LVRKRTEKVQLTTSHHFSSISGMKPKMKNHFRAHQLSIWLRLIPELHKAGMEDVIARHNLFKNHDDMSLYDGPVKPDSLSRLSFLEDSFKRRGGGNSSLDLALFNGKQRNSSHFLIKLTNRFLLSVFF
jgi:hypothetical protein